MQSQLAVLLLLGTASAFAQPSFLYPTTIPMGAAVTSIVGGDFNNDGLGDFAVAYGTSLSVFLGKPDGTFTRKDLTNLPPGFTVEFFMAATDVNVDHKLDLIGVGSDPSPACCDFILYGNGDGTFQPPVYNLAGGIAVADFNGDGIPDILVRIQPGIATELGNGDGTFRSLGPIAGTLGYGYGFLTNLLIADFNNDGFPDVAWAGQTGGPYVFLSNGDGSFRSIGITAGVGNGVRPMAGGDVNGDGKTDIVQLADGVSVLLGDGTGSFQLGRSYPSPMFVFNYDEPQVTLADFEGDKKLDFASSFYVYPGNGDGTFRPPIYFGQMDTFSLAVQPFQLPIIVQDVNGDGKPDIIGIGSDGHSVNVLINNSGTPVASAPAFLVGNGDIVLAPGALGSIFGTGLSSTTASATVPLPTAIGNTIVELVDYSGKTFQAPLLYVSPTQINFQVPDDAAQGLAIINVMGNGRPRGAHSTFIQDRATALFTLDGTGKGAPVSSALSVDAKGNQAPIPTTSCTPDGQCIGLPIPIGSAGQVYLSLYGTGFRHATAGQCQVGKTDVTPTYFGPQGPGALIDQVNIPIPANTPKGTVNISCQFGPSFYSYHGNGNTVTITVQ